MGASGFFDYGKGTNANAIFNALREDAQHEHGSRGYTGSIAEKHSFTVVSRTPMPLSYWQSNAAQDKFGEGDKWGDALCAPYAEKVVKGEKEYTIKFKAADRSEARSKALKIIEAKGRSKKGTEIEVSIRSIDKVSDSGKPKAVKVKSTEPTTFKLRFIEKGYTKPFHGRTTYSSITEAKKGFAEWIGKFANGGTSKPIGIIKIEGVHDYEVILSSKEPTWEVTGTRRQIAIGRQIGYAFWGWASS